MVHASEGKNLGLSFSKDPEGATVTKISESGLAFEANNKRLVRGCKLVAVQGQSVKDISAAQGLALLVNEMKKARSQEPPTFTARFSPPVAAPPRMPRVPRVFTGESRIGTADGQYLVDKYYGDGKGENNESAGSTHALTHDA